MMVVLFVPAVLLAFIRILFSFTIVSSLPDHQDDVFNTTLSSIKSPVLQELHHLSSKTTSHSMRAIIQRIRADYHHFLNMIHLHPCQHLYIDLGTNTGMQIRKLYEPEFYPNASVHSYYNHFFGEATENVRKHVCAIGFEANEVHTPRLQQMQSYYQSKGYSMMIFTETAVSTSFDNMVFYQDKRAHEAHHEWGASVFPWDHQGDMNKHAITVPSIDLAVLLTEIYSHFHSTKAEGRGSEAGRNESHHIIMKMDIEASELIVLPHLLMHGVLCNTDVLLIEWHPHLQVIPDNELNEFKKFFSNLSQNRERYHCSFKMVEMDDETYFEGADPHPLVV